MIDFRTHPDQYHHWTIEIDGPVATLAMSVDEKAGLDTGYELKLNSYDLGVDIELYDAIQRLRFEHPEIGAVVISSRQDRVFCAGANIRMLGQASHAAKVNFCKFTNETRLSIEDATENSRQTYLCAINGTAAGGGYELAMATDHIMLVDDGLTTVSLPEAPLLAVLPGTGGLTRLVDKRRVRRDRADFFCTTEDGVRGERAVDWGLVDEIVPASQFLETVAVRARMLAGNTDRPNGARGKELTALDRTIDGDQIHYPHLDCDINRTIGVAAITLRGPDDDPPTDSAAAHAAGAAFWPLALARELDDLVLHLRANENEVGTLAFRTDGVVECVLAHDQFLLAHREDWLIREILLFWKRTLKRLDVTARSLIALIEPGSCFAGLLLEVALATDRSFMLDGQFEGDNRPPAVIQLSESNYGTLPMGNGLTRLASRFLGDADALSRTRDSLGDNVDAAGASDLGLVTFTPDDIDWEDEVRIALEERASFSPDALTGLEANLRFAGPETMETKIFGRLTAWQNWIFQRPNAVGKSGALSLYGSGQRAAFDKKRV